MIMTARARLVIDRAARLFFRELEDARSRKYSPRREMEGLRAGLTYAVAPTVEEIIRECDCAWARAREIRREMGLGVEARAAATKSSAEVCVIGTVDEGRAEESVYATLAREFAELNKTYPVILAAMAGGSYKTRAVRRFFAHVRDHPWRDEAEFLDTQSAYITILGRKLARATHDTRAIDRARAATRDALAENERATKEQIEHAQAEAARINEARAHSRAVDMRARVAADAAIILRDEVRPTVVAFDDSQ